MVAPQPSSLDRAPEPQGAAIIQATDLVKTYTAGSVAIQALQRVSLTVPHGEMLAIMGPSGCGKTTLLNCLSGLDSVDSGTVMIDGIDINSLNDNAKTLYRARHMGFVFQFYNLLPVLSAVENVEIPLVVSGVPGKEARELKGAPLKALVRKLALAMWVVGAAEGTFEVERLLGLPAQRRRPANKTGRKGGVAIAAR